MNHNAIVGIAYSVLFAGILGANMYVNNINFRNFSTTEAKRTSTGVNITLKEYKMFHFGENRRIIAEYIEGIFPNKPKIHIYDLKSLNSFYDYFDDFGDGTVDSIILPSGFSYRKENEDLF